MSEVPAPPCQRIRMKISTAGGGIEFRITEGTRTLASFVVESPDEAQRLIAAIVASAIGLGWLGVDAEGTLPPTFGARAMRIPEPIGGARDRTSPSVPSAPAGHCARGHSWRRPGRAGR